ncbi:hypothetical protein HPB49_022626 [Dermacentor silvarum]|uniref:Uncharacterized protein n=1 Tax=Dermacentor silvarum TaxID=543639 RepID=A0ACB8DQP5_DERSI|nr:hypothetical protein HPB49_022626 [Dermacentor silvarum]
MSMLLCCVVLVVASVHQQEGGDNTDSTSSSVDGQPTSWENFGTAATAKMQNQRPGVPRIQNGGCPFAMKHVALGDPPREDKLKAQLALCFEKASRTIMTSVRNTANGTDGLDANAETASEMECTASPLCRRREDQRCDASKPYREADGRCNNLEHPEWGAAGACMRRLLAPAYADGVSAPRVSVKSGRALPSARLVSYTAHPERAVYDGRWSEMIVHVAQFVAHDISAVLVIDPEGPEFSQNLGRDTYNCCNAKSRSDPECFSIDVPADDPFYGRHAVRCMNFRRSAPCLTCRLGELPISQDLQLDGAYSVRSFGSEMQRWLLKEQLINGSKLLPASSWPNTDQCSKQRDNRHCFKGGDRRVNQNIGLLLMHTIWFREHNRVARKIARVNPHWDDERLFQVTRRIVEARLQHIVYNELLKEVLGPEGVKRNQLSPLRAGYTTYDARVDATVANEFTTAAFRLGHSLIDADNETISLSGKQTLRLPLRHNWFNPFAFYESDVIDAVTTDRYGTHDVTRHAFRMPGGLRPFGVDLFAFDIQRGRDHGLRAYADYVQHCASDVRLEAFEHLEKFMPRDVVELFASLYDDVRDVDLFSAGLAERTLPSSIVGPTFACLVGPMFRRLKFGDRFYYEHGGQAGTFTPGESSPHAST